MPVDVLALAFTRQRPEFELAVDVLLDLDGVIAVCGPSGSGKTTLLRVIAGLERPDSGRLSLGGTILDEARSRQRVPPFRRGFGLVAQRGGLFTHLDVHGNLAFASHRASATGPPLTHGAVVESLELGPLLDRRVDTLSGGERQRVALGRTLLARPRLLLLDEPFAALDSARRGELVRYLERIRDEFAIPMIYVSHALDEVARLAAWILVLERGRVEALGPALDVLPRLDLQPLTGRREAAAILTGRIQRRDPDWSTYQVAVGTARLTLPDSAQSAAGPALAPGHDVRIRIRASDVALALSPPPDTSINNVLPAQVVEIAVAAGPAAGPWAEVLLSVEGQSLRARLTRQSLARLDLRPGAPVYALIRSVSFDR